MLILMKAKKKDLKWERADNSTHVWTILIFCFQRGFMDIVSFECHDKLWRLIVTTVLPMGKFDDYPRSTKKSFLKNKQD